jgi:hypothetical protein
MNLTPIQREQVRLSLLRYALSLASPRLLLSYLRGEGFAGISLEQVQGEIQYLADKGFFTKEDKVVSPENALWRTTAAGRDYLATQGHE